MTIAGALVSLSVTIIIILMDNRDTVQLDFCSALGMLDLVQGVCDHLGKLVGFDKDSVHWVGVAVRESVINAIKHGNAGDESKRVQVEFTYSLENPSEGLEIVVRDEGAGFDPANLPDPLASENLSKTSGRGVFLMQKFMDEVEWFCLPEGGMEVRMSKRCIPKV